MARSRQKRKPVQYAAPDVDGFDDLADELEPEPARRVDERTITVAVDTSPIKGYLGSRSIQFYGKREDAETITRIMHGEGLATRQDVIRLLLQRVRDGAA